MNIRAVRIVVVGLFQFSFVVKGQTLLVKTGETKEINSSYNPIYLDKLEMQQGSKIVVSQDLPNHIWQVQIKEAVFALDTIIDASGAPGTPGAKQTFVPPEAPECRPGGQVASPGGDGGPGQSGGELNILMGIRQLGHLYIYASGGRGGNGGQGGIGAKGGNANCSCDGGSGGNGGIGGRGGPGGDTSHVIINWYSLANFNPNPHPQTQQSPNEDPKGRIVVYDVPVGLEVQGSRGTHGSGGPGGQEGPAGGAHCCTFWCKGSGGGGSPGPTGPDGTDGDYNAPAIQRINPPAFKTLFQ